jgi:hypothetical protein
LVILSLFFVLGSALIVVPPMLIYHASKLSQMLAMLRDGTNQMDDARTTELEARVRTFKAVVLVFW